MIHVAWPWMALLLPLPWLFSRFCLPAQPQGSALFLPFVTALPPVSPSLLIRKLPRLHAIVLALIWLLLVASATRPQWLGDPQPIPTTGRRLLLAVDVSGSMANRDMAGNYTRLQVVQAVASEFIGHRYGDRVGLILFGSQPYIQAPLTADLETVKQFLTQAMIGMAGTETAIGDAIGLAIKRFCTDRSTERDHQHEENNKGETVLILLTDGSSNAGAVPPLEAAKLAAGAGLRIYTIGVGAEVQESIFGSAGNSDLDEDTLKSIAKMTNGSYFRATDATALQNVYAEIDKLEPSAGREQWYRPSEEWFHWPLAIALGLSVLSVPTMLLHKRHKGNRL
ncbi:MAG: VWA domain-containing protein [Pseudomonadota bacterium]